MDDNAIAESVTDEVVRVWPAYVVPITVKGKKA